MEVNGGEKCLGEIHMDQDVTAVLAMSHLNLKGIKKNMSRYVLLTHTYALYFQTSQKKILARHKALFII